MIQSTTTVPPVKLKGLGDSFHVSIDPSQPEEILLEHLGKVFDNLRHLAINARVILDPGDPTAHAPLVDRLGAYLKSKYPVGQVSGPAKEKDPEKERVRKREVERGWDNRKSDVLMLAGRVRSGQTVAAKKHLVILGDVNPGAEISAGGDIIVLGSLCGTALAGQPENENAIILALDFRPTQIQIGGFVAAGLPGESGNRQPEFAHVDNGSVIVENYTKASPFAKIPWPEIR